ncbi:unnamed protein product [Rotaria magnacalcarata]|uniref:Uncharacterized protein n=1 Tax=Rotaria magnacalcarata TaxID=392030 RepID=A0A8S3G411_9BILA|nr:unnamed protein product [Rotaria magnacalcarata]
MSNESLINNRVHKKCYTKMTRKLPPIKMKKQQINTSLNVSSDVLNDISLDRSLLNIDNCEFNIEQVVYATNPLSTD